MARLIFTGITSLDGYIADENGKFEWGEPDEEVHAFVNDLERPIGTYLYGRRLYEVMAYWDTAHAVANQSAVALDYAELWQAAEKVVYSTSLTGTTTARTRLERTFDPQAVRAMKESADRDLSVGGPALAAHALRAGLVDDIQIFVSPVVVGGGTPFLPRGVRFALELVDQRRFRAGFTYVHYRIAS